MVVVHDLSEEEKVTITFPDVWAVGISIIQSEFVIGALAFDGMLQLDIYLVMIENLVHDWAEHMAKDIFSRPPRRVLNDNHCIIDGLMHEK